MSSVPSRLRDCHFFFLIHKQIDSLLILVYGMILLHVPCNDSFYVIRIPSERFLLLFPFLIIRKCILVFGLCFNINWIRMRLIFLFVFLSLRN